MSVVSGAEPHGKLRGALLQHRLMMKLLRHCTFGCVLDITQTRCFAARTAKWATTSVNSILYSSAVMTGFKVNQANIPTYVDRLGEPHTFGCH